LNTTQAAFATAAITQTPNKLKRFKKIFFENSWSLLIWAYAASARGLITINDKKLLSKQDSGFKHNSQIIVKFSA
tara:strand:- start:3038 stop:3262 length:225 start_codon:yes stop_codon:yes gene_type:complete